MKKTTKTLIVLVALMAATMFAQGQTISTKYSDAEIETLIRDHKRMKSRHVQVDGVLLQKFQQDFPNARNARSVKWKTAAGIYEVEFKVENREWEAYYDADGNLLMYETEIGIQELPAIVKNAAEARYPGYRFDEIDKIVKGRQTHYKIEMKSGKSKAKMRITNAGVFVQ